MRPYKCRHLELAYLHFLRAEIEVLSLKKITVTLTGYHQVWVGACNGSSELTNEKLAEIFATLQQTGPIKQVERGLD